MSYRLIIEVYAGYSAKMLVASNQSKTSFHLEDTIVNNRGQYNRRYQEYYATQDR